MNKMRNYVMMVSAMFIILSCSAQSGDSKVANLKLDDMTEEQKASYSYGVLVGDNLKRMEIDNLDPDVILKAIKDVLEGNELQMNVQDAQVKWQAVADDAQRKVLEKEQLAYIKNKKIGTEFMAENAKKEGVVTLENGLQYKVVKEGNGPKPSLNDRVNVHYHGMLIDGTVFDSSVERGTPATFGLTQVIKGWTEILQLMPVGSKWTVYIPENLAYGANPRPGGAIKPYMTLIFDIELLSIAE